MRSESRNALEYWMFMIPFSPVAARVALAVLQIAPTEASVERCFSTQGWIHNDRRNWLDEGMLLAFRCCQQRDGDQLRNFVFVQ